MFRAPLRRIRPASLPAARPQVVARRAASTAPAKKGTWKGAAARWGVAAGALYWYCTSPLFADDPAPQVKVPIVEDDEVTVDKVIEQKRKEIEARAREREAKEAALKAEAEAEAEADKKQPQEQENTQTQEAPEDAAPLDTPGGSPQALEEEVDQQADQQAAFNPETGEINWDCPCLGGMAHGPCGEEFRAAFSCFVYSDVEPKGMDCIDKFQGMQDCFRKHPDVYGAELAEEEEAEAEARAVVDAEKEGKGVEAATTTPKDDSAPVKVAPVKEAAINETKPEEPTTPEPAKDEKST